MTPTEVWEGYDPTSLPLESSIISSDSVDNIVCTKQYFTAEATQQGRIRAYIEMYSDIRWKDAHDAVLLLGHCNRKNNTDFIKTLIKEGYVVGALDYCGDIERTENVTTFPPQLSFASFPKCKKNLNTLIDSARNTPWFVWSKIARRAITLMHQYAVVNNGHIGVIAIGEGGHFAWQVAGMDRRVRSLVVIGDSGFRWAKDKPKFTEGNVISSENDRAFSMGVGSETYARLVQCPTLLIATRLARSSDVDRAGDMITLVKSKNKQLLISRGMEAQITRGAVEVMMRWLHKSFTQADTVSTCPSAAFENVDGKLYLRVNTECDCEGLQVFLCYGEPHPSARHWDMSTDVQKIDTNTYTLAVPVYDPKELITAYATVEYEDGNYISTPVQGIYPVQSGLGASGELRESSHIMYDGSMGLGEFSSLTRESVLDEDAITLADGPFDITGITATKGGLVLCRSVAELKAMRKSSNLHFDAYSPVEREVCIKMYTYPEMKKYVALVNLKGGEFWEKIILKSSDFKSDNGKMLPEFSTAKILAITDAEGIIFNNFLWI